MLNRIFFTLSQSLKHYSAIHQLKQNSVNTIADIVYHELVEKNIKIPVSRQRKAEFLDKF